MNYSRLVAVNAKILAPSLSICHSHASRLVDMSSRTYDSIKEF